MKETEELTQKEGELMGRLLKSQKMFKWSPLFVILVLVPKIIMDFSAAYREAEAAGIESMWVTALGTHYQSTEMYSGAAFIVAKNFQQGLPYSLLTVGFVLFSFPIYRRQKLAIKLWNILESKENSEDDGGGDDGGSVTGGVGNGGGSDGGSEGGETEDGVSDKK